MRISIALYFYFGTCNYWTIIHLFRIGHSTVCNILQVVGEAIIEKILPRITRLLNETEAQIIIRKFEISGFPQVVGVRDGCQ